MFIVKKIPSLHRVACPFCRDRLVCCRPDHDCYASAMINKRCTARWPQWHAAHSDNQRYPRSPTHMLLRYLFFYLYFVTAGFYEFAPAPSYNNLIS